MADVGLIAAMAVFFVSQIYLWWQWNRIGNWANDRADEWRAKYMDTLAECDKLRTELAAIKTWKGGRALDRPRRARHRRHRESERE